MKCFIAGLHFKLRLALTLVLTTVIFNDVVLLAEILLITPKNHYITQDKFWDVLCRHTVQQCHPSCKGRRPCLYRASYTSEVSRMEIEG